MYRQGDLLFIKADKLGKDCTLLKDTLDILGSSVTGHTHRLNKGLVYVHEPKWEDNANFYIQLEEDAELLHEEHKMIPLPKGIYKVIRQREVNGYVVD